jgi:hypothetical protein
MGKRATLLGRAIATAIITDTEDNKGSLLVRVLAFFQILSIKLSKFSPDLFQRLRREAWQIDESSYRQSFGEGVGIEGLIPAGDLGYSGSVSIHWYKLSI